MTPNDETNRFPDPTVADPRHRFASGYVVDSERVAEEILRKVHLVRWARRELAFGQTPEPSGPDL